MTGLYVNGKAYPSGAIEAGRVQMGHAMAGETLSVDQISLTVTDGVAPLIAADQTEPLITADDHALFCEAVNMNAARPGRRLTISPDGERLITGWIESVRHQGGDRWKITALSVVGKFLSSRHMGGIYESVPAADVYAELLKGTTYVIDDAVAAATVSGYLPIAIRRDNLQQLLMVTGATLRTDERGKIYISAMSEGVAGVIGPDRCYIGGSVEESERIDGLQLTEHNYFKSGETAVLFEDGVDGEELIEFSEPYHSLEITGGTIAESGVNFARIHATGTVTLTGKPYVHVTRRVSVGNTSPAANIKSVSRCTLATPQIAQALAERLLAVLRCNRVIRVSATLGNERAGDVVDIFNPYTRKLERGTLRSQTVSLSGVNKAAMECLVGYMPGGVLSGFTNYVRLTNSGTWTVPSGVDVIRIILVGGGSGGSGGSRGTAGGDSNEHAFGDGGNGGKAGKAGEGGKVFEISLRVAAAQTFDYVCGAGGAGGAGETEAAKAADGGLGIDTIFGDYSSAYGRRYAYGYLEGKTGATLAASGAEGYAGGNGGDGTDEDWDWSGEGDTAVAAKGKKGEPVENYAGGKAGKFYSDEIHERSYTDYTGAGGGGAAWGSAGGNVGTKTESATGGDGATGISGENAAVYGQGGGAGNGGGGGGGAGTIRRYRLGEVTYFVASGGAPGNGSNGGKGGDGVIYIYY